jgi:hypothetical protein
MAVLAAVEIIFTLLVAQETHLPHLHHREITAVVVLIQAETILMVAVVVAAQERLELLLYQIVLALAVMAHQIPFLVQQ